MRDASVNAWPVFAGRAVVAVFVMALLFTAFGEHVSPAVGADLTGRISSARNGQSYFEKLMRQQDRILARMDRKGDAVRRRIKRGARIIKRTHKRYVIASRVARVSSARLAEAEARFPDPAEAPDPANWHEKMIRLRHEAAQSLKQRHGLGERLRRSTRKYSARKRQYAKIRRERRPAIRKRDYAEGALAAQIVQMTSLAQQRADSQTDVRLVADGNTFAWPSKGKITQSFGCTGFRLNPRRGSCRHFHDGVDLVAGYGSDVRAAAVGVIAFVGWNPWDEGSRAFIIVVGHPDGYVTRYGHLVPNHKVRVGQLVRKGQTIGKMGSTGNSTGTHLHMELLRYTTPLNPMAYLPDGVVKPNKAKHPHKGKKAHKGKHGNRGKKSHKGEQSKGKPHEGVKADRRKSARNGTKPSAIETAESTIDCVVLPEVTDQVSALLAEARFPGYFGPGEMPSSPIGDVSCDPDAANLMASQTPEVRPIPVIKSAVATPLPTGPEAEAVRLPLRGTSPVPQ